MRILRFIILTSVFLVSALTSLQAQVLTEPTIVYGQEKKYEIGGIAVEGAHNYDDYILIGLSGLTVGEMISVPGDEITAAVKRYWKQGLFSDVKITADSIVDEKVFLKIYLTMRPRVSQININGVKKSEHDDLQEKMGIVKGNQLTPNMVDKAKIIDNKTMQAGDVVIALPSTGVHSNGFSLVRKVFDVENADLNAPVEKLGGKSLGEVLLTPTKIYVKPVLALLKEVTVRGISHITGGGFYENIPRCIPDGLCARIEKSRVKVLPIFELIAEKGGISEHDMFNTYNMGVGMSVVVPAAEADKAVKVLQDNGIDAYVIGEITEGEHKIEII